MSGQKTHVPPAALRSYTVTIKSCDRDLTSYQLRAESEHLALNKAIEFHYVGDVDGNREGRTTAMKVNDEITISRVK